MKLLLFGGTFNPPHNGHMSLLKNAINAVNPDEVIVIPAATPPHKQAALAPAALRLAMCQCFRPLFPALQVSDIELSRPGKSYTWHTVQTLQKSHPGASLFLCVGTDMLASFPKWYNFKKLLASVTLVAQSREDDDATALHASAKSLRALGGHVLLAPGSVLPVSSTQLRAALCADQDVSSLVPPSVLAIIQAHSLYRSTQSPQPPPKET